MNGVSRYDGETFTTFNVNYGLAGNTVFAIHGGERIGKNGEIPQNQIACR